MRTLAFAALTLGALAGTTHAETLPAIIGARAATALPEHLALAAVHLPRNLHAIDADPAAVDVEFPAARPGRASVRVRLRGKRPRTVFVPVTIATLADVPVAVRALAPGETVTAADVRWERRPAPHGAAAASPVGQEVHAAIAAGEPLDDARLTAPPPVPRGTDLRVEVRRGSVIVRARGKLEVSARVGGTARVRLIGGGLVTGTLVDRSRFVVEAP
mgnify:CR=1 FL=1